MSTNGKDPAAELAAERERYERIRRINERLFVDDVLERALDAVGVRPELKRGAFALHRGKVTVVEDPTANYGMRTVIEAGGEQLDLSDYLQNWAHSDEEARAYLLPERRNDGRVLYRSTMTAAEKSAYIREHTKAKYDEIPWAPADA